MTNLLDDFEKKLLENRCTRCADLRSEHRPNKEKSSSKLLELESKIILSAKRVTNLIEIAEFCMKQILKLKTTACIKQNYLDSWIEIDLKNALNELAELSTMITNYFFWLKTEDFLKLGEYFKWKSDLNVLVRRCDVLKRLK